MPNRPTDLIIGTSLVTAEAIAQELRAKLINRIAKRRKYSQWELLTIARNILREYEPILAENLLTADLASWIAGVDAVVKRMPGQSLAAFLRDAGGPTPPLPPLSELMGDFPGEPRVRFPLLERAAESLQERGVVTREQFDKLSAEAKERAFTAAYIDSEETLEKIRDVLARNVEEGPSLRIFRGELEEEIGKSAIGPAHLENIFRTNVQASFRDGFETIASHPIVDEIFPYQEYLPIRDGRVRSEHLALATLGLSGTAIYRRDDPFWNAWSPPNGFNCFLPGTVVQGRFNVGLKSFYAGQAFEIVTRNGNRLSVTANHPILTMQGFVPAKLLRKGDDVLSYSNRIKGQCSEFQSSRVVMSGSLNGGSKQYAPSTIEQVFSSLSNLGRIGHFPLAAHDLHGDAQPQNGYVDVVGAIGNLSGNLKSSSSNRGTNLILSRVDVQAHSLARCGTSRLGCGSARPAIGDGHSLDEILGQMRVCRVPQFMNVGPASNLDASLYQTAANSWVADSEFSREVQECFAGAVASGNAFSLGGEVDDVRMPLDGLDFALSAKRYARPYEDPPQSAFAASRLARELCEDFAGTITLDEIIEVRDFEYCGHVYDLQSPVGYMVAESIIASNCRCGTNLLTIEAAARKGVQEAKTWLRTGQPPAVPEWRIDFIPFENVPGFGSRRARRAA